MSLLLVVVHIIVCIALIMIVLLQTGKGADMGAAFGGGSSQTLFGSTGASTFLSKATTVVAVVFMVTCMSLAYLSTNRTSSSIVLDKDAAAEQTTAETDTNETPAGTAETETDVRKTEAASTESADAPAEAPAESAGGEQSAETGGDVPE